MMAELHKKLVDRQSKTELQRKADKAGRRHLLTQEEYDLADREAAVLWITLFAPDGSVEEIPGPATDKKFG